MEITPDSDIRYIKGVGEKRAALYGRLGVFTVGDLLEHYPRDYIDLTAPKSISDAEEGELCAIRASVDAKTSEQRIRRGLSVYKVRVADDRADMLLTFFNMKYAVESLEIGKEYIFYGLFSKRFTGGEMTAPEIFPAEENGYLPRYPLTEGLSGKMISANVKAALEACGEQIPDELPEAVLKQYFLCSKTEAVRSIHFPESASALARAKRRLIFEEFFEFSLGLALTRGKNRAATGIPVRPCDLRPFFGALGFELTDAQKRVIAECTADLAKPVPMNRLVQGDVGSGKTAVAAACMYAAVQSGLQCAMMAPTEVLAAQHAETLEKLFAPLGIGVALLTGSMKEKQKEAARDAIASGLAQIAVGTHALIQEGVSFRELGLVVTDEQHRFGVRQRLALMEKARSPHALVMSATPIPRTLAFVMYGDLDVSVLDEMPKNRLPVKTYLIEPDLLPRAMSFIRKFADHGLQSYIVCPLIEQNEENLSLTAAADLAERLTGQELAGCSVGLLHGKMKPGEKERVMRAFAENRLQVLVSTTVVEVGVDVPNAVVMLIEDADRFGLSQLHQLRGRVGRGTEQSYCILVSGTRNAETQERLKLLCSTSDGFRIAEQDLRMRGPGDFFGFRQHGLPTLKMADMARDMKLLELAKQAAAELLEKDPDLKLPEHALLSDRTERLMRTAAVS
ncbi:MAG TPA: ATP-dependent DNA helicase RecG [Oscillospiraceae bacterium]|mgnify:CR=1 FL=1|nr:ATP-dependent DNA helicase RecG [Oscillospiraceae bacterium]